jgi:TM2 domain-containing membrane protein YozV
LNQEIKSESTGLVLSIILGFIGLVGVGQIYASKVGRGIIITIIGVIFLVIAIFTFGIGAILYIPLWIWAVFDTRSLIRRWNDYLDAHQDERRAW